MPATLRGQKRMPETPAHSPLIAARHSLHCASIDCLQTAAQARDALLNL
jgi:hypothetical protein